MASRPVDRFQVTLNRLRFVLIAGFCWFVFVIILPGNIRDLLQYGPNPLQPVADVVSIVILGSLTLYMMVQITTLTKVILPVLVGAALLAISEVVRIFETQDVFRARVPEIWRPAVQFLLINAVNDLGTVLFASGLFYAIIELLRARHLLQVQHQQLQDEMAERKRIEKEVEEQRLRVVTASRMSSLGAMASGLAHEIKNPLAIISGHCQQLDSLLQIGHRDPQPLLKATAVMQRNIERIDRIVRGLRRLSRDDPSTAVTTVPLETIVLDTIELCQARFQASDIALDVSDVPSGIRTECRPHEISQVLLNLLNNAHDAVTSCAEKWVLINAVDQGENVEIAVVDSGPGIPPEFREKIFDPFFTTKPPGEGLGVGLSISKRIMDTHEGTLFLDGESPHTRFVVRIPKQQPTPRPGSKY